MRLIDADKLKKDVGKLWEQMDDVDFGELVRDFWKVLNKYPTIDAVPVVHARWIRPTSYGGIRVDVPHCSACKGVPAGVNDDTRYCPNCGAKMDGGAEDEA